jgi:hypothetical protein
MWVLVRAARWIMVLLLVVDLVGSPFHDHHHDGGLAGYAIHSMQRAGEASHKDFTAPQHASLLDVHQQRWGHSLNALAPTGPKLASFKDCIEVDAVSPHLVLLELSPSSAEGFVHWQPGGQRVPILSFRTVPPDGRAPPALLV